MDKTPKCFQLGEELLWPLVGMGLSATRQATTLPVDLQPLGYNALVHHAGCLQSSMMAYGTGLWDEPWSDFYGNLARAVQPYAHYTTLHGASSNWRMASANGGVPAAARPVKS